MLTKLKKVTVDLPRYYFSSLRRQDLCVCPLTVALGPVTTKGKIKEKKTFPRHLTLQTLSRRRALVRYNLLYSSLPSNKVIQKI